MNIEKLVSNNGRVIYVFQAHSFPQLITNLFLIDDGDQLILVDTGSAYHKSTKSLAQGIDQINEQYNQSFTLSDLGAILVTHGHIDHFGGLNFLREHTDAPIGIHILDRRTVAKYEERSALGVPRVRDFLQTTGLASSAIDELMDGYKSARLHYRSVPVDFLLDEETPYAGINFIHTPGHCAGMVCMQIDDIMITADHVLSRITPHQSPESLEPNTGLGHYYDALDKLARVSDIRLAIGSHDEPMADMYGRIAEIKAFHETRLEKTLGLCQAPATLNEIAGGLFGELKGFSILMGLEEAAAHVEYLYQRGQVNIANYAEVGSGESVIAQYVQEI